MISEHEDILVTQDQQGNKDLRDHLDQQEKLDLKEDLDQQEIQDLVVIQENPELLVNRDVTDLMEKRVMVVKLVNKALLVPQVVQVDPDPQDQLVLKETQDL